MNNVIFAGASEKFIHDETSKYLEIIIPEQPDGGEVAYGEKITALSEGDIIVAPPRSDFSVYGTGAGFLRVLIEQPVLPLKDVIIIKDVANAGLKHAAGQAATFFAAEGKNKKNVLAALGNLIVGYILSQTEERKVSPATDLVRADIAKNVSNSSYALDDFIKTLPLNYDYVRKLFKKEIGVNPREYLEGLRMELAAKLLSSGVSNKYSNYTVSQVAEACGFTEPLYFSRVFKKRYGVAPSEFKNSSFMFIY